MNAIAPIGHNSPPSPIDEALAPFSDDLSEAENWLDGSLVEDEAQLAAVDELLKSIKAAIKAAKAGEEAQAKPLHEAWRAAKAAWKPTLDDLDRIKAGLIKCGDPYKRKLALEKAQAEAKAKAQAEQARRAAENAARLAAASDIEAQRAAAAAKAAADEAQRRASAARKDKVKGLRPVHHYQIDDERAALHWIAKNDRDALAAFVAEYVRLNHRRTPIDGVGTWTAKEAF